jgi:hypothetical protein
MFLCAHVFCSSDDDQTELGIYILYEDVKSCPCEDVQILWSILVESHPPPLRLKH